MRDGSDGESTYDIGDSVSVISHHQNSQMIQNAVRAELKNMMMSQNPEMQAIMEQNEFPSRKSESAQIKELQRENEALAQKLRLQECAEEKEADFSDIDLSPLKNGTPPRDQAARQNKRKSSMATMALQHQVAQTPTGNTGKQALRSYWAQQRQFLTDELGYKMGGSL